MLWLAVSAVRSTVRSNKTRAGLGTWGITVCGTVARKNNDILYNEIGHTHAGDKKTRFTH